MSTAIRTRMLSMNSSNALAPWRQKTFLINASSRSCKHYQSTKDGNNWSNNCYHTQTQQQMLTVEQLHIKSKAQHPQSLFMIDESLLTEPKHFVYHRSMCVKMNIGSLPRGTFHHEPNISLHRGPWKTRHFYFFSITQKNIDRFS